MTSVVFYLFKNVKPHIILASPKFSGIVLNKQKFIQKVLPSHSLFSRNKIHAYTFDVPCLCALISPAVSSSVDCQYRTATTSSSSSSRSAPWVCTGPGPVAAPLEGQEREVEGSITGSNGGAPATVLVTPLMREGRVSWHPASGMSRLPLGSMVRREFSCPNQCFVPIS